MRVPLLLMLRFALRDPIKMGRGTTGVPRIRATDSATLPSSFTPCILGLTRRNCENSPRQMEALHVVTLARHFGAVVGGGKAHTGALIARSPWNARLWGVQKSGVLVLGGSL